MNFYFGNISDANSLLNTDLGVLIDDVNVNYKRNIVIPNCCIFKYNNESENDYYINVANRMRNAGFNGFKDWISQLLNDFQNSIYHDEFDKPVIYNSIIFLTDNDNVKCYIKNIFNNFGFPINQYKNIKNCKNLLF